MSWGRVDDTLWEHPKFEALREEGEYTAIALWCLAHSYTNGKGNPRLTVHEAAMLLCCDRSSAQSACDVLASRGLFDPSSASKQAPSWVIHDWQEYRSKNEAKVRAGRKGGEKSAESRRSRSQADAKHPDTRTQARAKQTRTPDPDPVPIPGPYKYIPRENFPEADRVVKFYLRSYPGRDIQADQQRGIITRQMERGYTAEQLCQAIEGSLSDPWRQKNHITGLRQIFKNSETIDALIARATAPPLAEEGRLTVALEAYQEALEREQREQREEAYRAAAANETHD